MPVTFVDHTAGYDSECAVLFPETVASPAGPVNHFGGIFCDREAARFRARVGDAAGSCSAQPAAGRGRAARARSGSRIDAYMLWDLIHDRAHSHGDLPFDPFMIRQRMPYWMYSLEELRCDLTAFAEAVELEREGFAFARNVQYAILFDRLFRFPITGSRVRNYDGLGGQLLFAYLHRHGFVHWTDNQLTIEWDRGRRRRRRAARGGRGALPRRHRPLEGRALDRRARAGVDVRAGRRRLALGAGPARRSPTRATRRPWLELVEADEFPLSMFYTR